MFERMGVAACFVSSFAGAAAAQTAIPDAVAAPGETTVLQVQAEGAQVYECKAGAGGALTWVFREPIATLLRDGRTVGRHYLGPTWELTDGSLVVGKVVAKAPGAGPGDIAALKLEAGAHAGAGLLGEATTIQRIHTAGGALDGPCGEAGVLRAVAYSADYVFLKK
jgi:hypothetical protein